MNNFTEEQLRNSMEKITYSECPGGPDPGCCEFCHGNCVTYSLNGIELNSNEMHIIDQLQMEKSS